MNLVLTNPLSGKGVDTPLLPSQQLVIDAKFSHDRNDRKYELVAVVIHSGTTAGGHYFAYVKYGKNWFDCNDAVITPIDKSQVMSLKSFQYAIYTLLD